MMNSSKIIIVPDWPFPSFQAHFDAWSEITGAQVVSYKSYLNQLHDKRTFLKNKWFTFRCLLEYLSWAIGGFSRDFQTKSGIRIGHHIIESRVKGHPLGKFKPYSPKTILSFVSAAKLSRSNPNTIGTKIIAHLVGDEAYGDGILAQMTSFSGIPTIKIRPYGRHISIQNFNPHTGFGGAEFYSIPKEQHSEQDINRILKNFENRVHGNYQSLSYMPTTLSQVSWQPKKHENAMVMFLHDFIDSPGIYGKSTFNDQWQWIKTTLKVARRNNGHLFIKPHPNAHPMAKQANLELMRFLNYNKSKISMIPDSVPLARIKEELNPKIILTMYGSVVAEAAILNLPILTTSTHPLATAHYDQRAASKSDYTQKLTLALQGQWAEPTPNSRAIARTFLDIQHYYAKQQIENIPLDDANDEDLIQLGFDVQQNSNIHGRRGQFITSKSKWDSSHYALYELTKKRILSSEAYVQYIRQITNSPLA